MFGLGPRDWMQTYSGVQYFPARPEVSKVRIVDIAHHLSMLCRYTGACRRFESVAEHSVLVSQVVPPEHAFAGLMHDATEAYVNDLNRPLKHSWLLWGYRRIEARNWAVIAEKFGLPVVLPQCVHDADIAVLRAEQNALMLPLPADQGWPDYAADVEIQCWPPEVAEKRFLDRFFDLSKGCPFILPVYRTPLITVEGCAV